MLQTIIEDLELLIIMEKELSSKNKEKTAAVFRKIRVLKDAVNLSNYRSGEFDALENSLEQDPSLGKTSLPSENMGILTFDRKLSDTKVTGYSKIRELKLVKVGLASAERMLEWAEKILPNGKIFGEVLNANTLHYKTFKPHKGGLFCERIFGPLKDFECACGLKHKSLNEQSSIENLTENKVSLRTFCQVCDVEYTWSVIRRYQLGYIKLASPVSHLWYLRTNPSYLSLLLNIKKKDLEAVVYCTQITTLEYYWKPLNSLQLNLTASTLIDSYKKYKIENFDIKTRKNFLKNKTKQKQILESRKRETKKLNRQVFHFVSTKMNTSQQLRALENESLETKKKYLEKSFQLSSEQFTSRASLQSKEVQYFLKQKITKNVKKHSFLNIYNQFNQKCYKQLFLLIGQKNSIIRAKLKNSLTSTPSLHTTLIQHLKIKTKQKAEKSKENPRKPTAILLDRQFFMRLMLSKNRVDSVPAFLKVKSTEFSSMNKQRLFFNIDRKSEASLMFIEGLLGFSKKKEFQATWSSIYENVTSSIQFICLNHDIYLEKFNYPRFLSSEQTGFNSSIPDIFFLYLLVVIQTSTHSIFEKKRPILKEILTKKIFVKKEFGAKFLQKNALFSERKKPLLLISFNLLFSLTPKKFYVYLSQLLKFVHPVIVRLSNLVVKPISVSKALEPYNGDLKKNKKGPQKDSMIFFQPERAANGDINFPGFLILRSLHLKNKSLGKMQALFNELKDQKKLFLCLKAQSSKDNNLHFYIKRLQHFVQKLGLFKSRIFDDFNLRNNIYTVAYSTGWLTEKEWRYFLYYNTAQLEFGDQILMFYKSRFNSESFLKTPPRMAVSDTSILPLSKASATPIIGANLIQKILFQYEGDEIQKMAKQNQNILPKLNREIRLSKERASKKSDFLRLYKILQKRDQIIRRLKLLRKFVKRNVVPSSTILTILPVLPPDLRPILKMQNQIAASDLNRFYQRIIYRNERLKKFLKSNASTLDFEAGFEIKYAQRLLQEAVDNLIQNGKGQVKPETNSRGQPLKSLSEILKGKQGRFRQYLLGKRVDYSGRSVIVVGPKLKIHQCGLPFEMALELFLPFLIKRIFQYKYARTIVGAKTILKNQKRLIWDLLEEIMEDSPILLNRAPTLHRLGIQAFQPKLIEGRAILLHPLVCPAFNADFDGDQMAVHLPITVEARSESWKLMLSRNHLLSPATGDPILLPSQDMILGCYYLTNESLQMSRFNQHRPFLSGTSFYFSNFDQVVSAYEQERIHLQTPIWLKWNGFIEMESKDSLPIEIRVESDGSWIELRTKIQIDFTNKGIWKNGFVRTTAGRVLVNSIVEGCIQKAFSAKIY